MFPFSSFKQFGPYHIASHRGIIRKKIRKIAAPVEMNNFKQHENASEPTPRPCRTHHKGRLASLMPLSESITDMEEYCTKCALPELESPKASESPPKSPHEMPYSSIFKRSVGGCYNARLLTVDSSG